MVTRPPRDEKDMNDEKSSDVNQREEAATVQLDRQSQKLHICIRKISSAFSECKELMCLSQFSPWCSTTHHSEQQSSIFREEMSISSKNAADASQKPLPEKCSCQTRAVLLYLTKFGLNLCSILDLSVHFKSSAL